MKTKRLRKRYSSYRTNYSDSETDSSAWLLTFADLLMLLLTLFILRLSMSSFTKPAEASLGQMFTLNKSSSEETLAKEKLLPESISNISEIENGHYFSSLLGPSSFAENSTELTFKAEEILNTITKTFHQDGSRFKITIDTSKKCESQDCQLVFESAADGELSDQRALAIKRQLLDAGVEEKSISLASYGSSRCSSAGICERLSIEIFSPGFSQQTK